MVLLAKAFAVPDFKDKKGMALLDSVVWHVLVMALPLGVIPGCRQPTPEAFLE